MEAKTADIPSAREVIEANGGSLHIAEPPDGTPCNVLLGAVQQWGIKWTEAELNALVKAAIEYDRARREAELEEMPGGLPYGIKNPKIAVDLALVKNARVLSPSPIEAPKTEGL